MTWIENNLKELVDIKTGKKDANEGDENGTFRFYTCAKDYSFIKEYAFDEEAILVSGNGAYVGYVHYFNGKFDAYQRTYILSNFKVDVFFLYHYLGEKLRFRIHREKQDGATPYITKGTLAKFKVEYPENPAEQTAIATLLSKADEAIAATQNSIKAAEKLKKALMQNLLTGKLKPDGTWRNDDEFYEDEKFGKVPKGWHIIKGNKITTKITKGQSPKWQGFEYQDSGILFVTSENVRDGFIEVDNPKFLPIEFHNKIKNSQLKKGDLLINIVGASIGRCAVFNLDDEYANTNQAVCVFRPDEENDSDFLAYYIQNGQTQQRLLSTQVETARANLSLGDFRKFKFVIPESKDEQILIADKLNEVNFNVQSKQTKIQTLQRLKKSLMQNLLTGKLRLPAEFVKQFEEVEETIKR
jgi:type I restriction enzyme S subunit